MHPSHERDGGSTPGDGRPWGVTETVSEGEEGLPITKPLPFLAPSEAGMDFEGSPDLLGIGRTGKRSVSMTELPRKASAGSENPTGVWGTSTWKFLAPSSESNCNIPRLNINGWTLLQGLPIHFHAVNFATLGECHKAAALSTWTGTHANSSFKCGGSGISPTCPYLTFEHMPMPGSTRCWSSLMHSSHAAFQLSHGTCTPTYVWQTLQQLTSVHGC